MNNTIENFCIDMNGHHNLKKKYFVYLLILLEMHEIFLYLPLSLSTLVCINILYNRNMSESSSEPERWELCEHSNVFLFFLPSVARMKTNFSRAKSPCICGSDVIAAGGHFQMNICVLLALQGKDTFINTKISVMELFKRWSLL